MTTDFTETNYWISRFQAVSKLQARYLWLLLVLGIFYWAVNGVVQSGAKDVLRLPIVDLELSAMVVWASGPAVLAFILICISGSLRAVTRARALLNMDADNVPPGSMEKFDVSPNALDMAAYTTESTWGWLTKLLYFIYPATLSIFLIEAAWLLWLLTESSTLIPAKALFELFGATLVFIAFWQLLKTWYLRFLRVSRDLRKGDPSAEGFGTS